MSALVITGGTVVTATQTIRADVRVENGRIAEAGPTLNVDNAQVMDATGCFILPGGVDVHTHFDLTVNGLKVSDGFELGTMSALCGGTTTIVEHPGFVEDGSLFTPLADTRTHALNRACTDYGVHGVVSRVDENTPDDLATLVHGGVPSVKVYTTYAGRLNDDELSTVLAAMGREHGLVTVHAENHAAITQLTADLRAKGQTTPPAHPASRPGWCEAEAVQRLIALSRAADNAPLYIVHLSTKAGLEHVRAAKAEGLPVYAETCPHYLLLTDERYQRPGSEALQYVMSPPLRTPEDCEALWQGLADGTIDTVATDHCCFSLQQKIERGGNNVFDCPGGIPGAETRLPLLWSEGVAKNRLTMNRFVELVSTAPARIMGLAPAKGDIAPGADADIVIFDPHATRTLSPETLAHPADYTPFAGIEVSGWPRAVLLRGMLGAREGRFTGQPGMGQYMPRTPNARQ
jgi:dihydropyrimidinase